MDKRLLRSKIHTWARMRSAGPMKDRRKEMTDEDHIEEGIDEQEKETKEEEEEA